MKFTDKVYNVLKSLALIWLPAAGGLYFGLSQYWPLPDVASVVGSISLADTFLGGVLKLSSKGYTAAPPETDGSVTIVPATEDSKKQFIFTLDPDKVEQKEVIHLQVARQA